MSVPFLLGVAERMNPRGEPNLAVPMDIIGLRQVVISHLYPLDIQNLLLVIGFGPGAPKQGRISILAPNDQEQVWFEYSMDTGKNWSDQIVIGFSFRDTPFRPTVWRPEHLRVCFSSNTSPPVQIGGIRFEYLPPPSLTTEQLRAIESNPSLPTEIRWDLKCSECRDGITPVVARRRPTELHSSPEQPRCTWYQDLGDTFVCSCGKFSIPLRYLRESMHVLLRPGMFLPDASMTMSASVSVAEVERILDTFIRLLDREPPEEDVQSFIQSNLIMLAPFAARQIFFKPPILNMYRADFGIVTSRQELMLVEIERPSLALLRADGAPTAELTHAFSQPQCWNDAILEHRAAVLHGIKNCPTNITNVRYVVIAGRSGRYDRDALARLVRTSQFAEFMTYDHLVEAIRNTTRSAAV